MVRDQARAEALAHEFGARHAYSDWRALLADPEVDAVHVATPVYLHEEQVIAAAEAGKHVMCDKPMAMSSAECRRMIDACRSHGVHLQVSFLMRFGSIHQRLRREIAEGRFGAIVEARATIFKWMPYDDAAWRVIPEQGGGGPLMDVGAHTIDLVTYLVGPMDRVMALTANRASTWRVEDTVSVLMRARSGAHAVIGHSFRAKGGMQTLEINGTEATAYVGPSFEDSSTTLLRMSDANGVRSETVPFENYYQLQVEHFADCLAGRATPIVTGEDGLANIAVIEAAYRSARSGVLEAVEA